MKLQQAVEQYLTLKQSLGLRFHTEGRILRAAQVFFCKLL